MMQALIVVFTAVSLYVLFNGSKLYTWNYLFGAGVILSLLTIEILANRHLEMFKEKCKIDNYFEGKTSEMTYGTSTYIQTCFSTSTLGRT